MENTDECYKCKFIKKCRRYYVEYNSECCKAHRGGKLWKKNLKNSKKKYKNL